MNCSNVEIGERIAKLRKRREMSQSDLSNELHVTREVVAKWENGTRDLKTEYTVALADFFKTTCDYILRGVEPQDIDIARETGLNGKTIEWLKGISKTSGKTYEMFGASFTLYNLTEAINMILPNRIMENVLRSVCKYIKSKHKCKEYCNIPDVDPTISKMCIPGSVGDTESWRETVTKNNEIRPLYEKEVEEVQPLALYTIQKDFIKLVELLGDSIYKEEQHGRNKGGDCNG